MAPNSQDAHWMHHALSLARRGIGLASPNPAVGCVVIDHNSELTVSVGVPLAIVPAIAPIDCSRH